MSFDEKRLTRGRLPSRQCSPDCQGRNPSRHPSRSWMGEYVAPRPSTPPTPNKVPTYRDHSYPERTPRYRTREKIYPQEWYRSQDSRNIPRNFEKQRRYPRYESNINQEFDESNQSYQSRNQNWDTNLQMNQNNVKRSLDNPYFSKFSNDELTYPELQQTSKANNDRKFEVISKYRNDRLNNEDFDIDKSLCTCESKERMSPIRNRMQRSEFQSEADGRAANVRLNRKEVRII